MFKKCTLVIGNCLQIQIPVQVEPQLRPVQRPSVRNIGYHRVNVLTWNVFCMCLMPLKLLSSERQSATHLSNDSRVHHWEKHLWHLKAVAACHCFYGFYLPHKMSPTWSSALGFQSGDPNLPYVSERSPFPQRHLQNSMQPGNFLKDRSKSSAYPIAIVKICFKSIYKYIYISIWYNSNIHVYTCVCALYYSLDIR